MRTQVLIIGAGPAGMLLGQLLQRQGIDTLVIERRSRQHVLSRIRAGILETGMVALLRRARVSRRLDKESFVHFGTVIANGEEQFRIDFRKLTGESVLVYGQSELSQDLFQARDALNAPILFDVEDVEIHDPNSDAPHVTLKSKGREMRIDCDFIAGCDGYHGVARQAIPASKRTEHEKTYPFGWLGVLSETPPVHHELIYSNSERGFAMCSIRTHGLSRYYIQCPLSDSPSDWSDQMFWDELRRRLPTPVAEAMKTGPSIEKSIAAMRSFICEPMRWGRLFLCGDAAHIMPPTGAKGLNTAASDVHYLSEGLIRYYNENDAEGIDTYSQRALARAWKAARFSWSATMLLHRFPDQTAFDLKMQQADLNFLRDNEAAQQVFAENYVGLPY